LEGQKLQSLRTNNVESSLAVARAALDAHEFKAAREAAEAAIRMLPREGAYLLLADIEEAETGDQGRVRQYLAQAVRAPRDPAWVADGFVSERWAPVSPVTGKLDAFEWRAPVERLGQLIEQGAPAHPSLALPPQTEVATVEAAASDSGKSTAESPDIVDAETEPADGAAAEATQQAKPDTSEPARMPDDPGVEPEQEKSERRFRLF
jgi:HemY protein